MCIARGENGFMTFLVTKLLVESCFQLALVVSWLMTAAPCRPWLVMLESPSSQYVGDHLQHHTDQAGTIKIQHIISSHTHA